MLRNTKFRYVLFWIFTFLLLGSVAMHAMDAGAGVESLGIPKEESDKLNKDFAEAQAAFAEAKAEFAEAQAEFKKELPALQALKTEFDAFLKEVDLNDSGWFKDFRNKVLYAMPVDESLSFGIYGADVLKFLFSVLFVYLDKLLFDRLSDYYHKSVITNFKGKKDLLVALYNEKVAFKDVKKFLQDPKSINSFINESISILDFDDAINYKLLSYIFFNLSEKEVAKFLEHQIFPATRTGFFSLFKTAGEMGKEEQRKPIPVYWMIEPLLMYSLFGGQSTLEDSSHTVRSFLLKLAGWDYKVLDSYGFDLTRRMVIMTLFLKRLNIWYQNMFKKYLKENMQYFLKILSDIKDPNGSATDADEALKSFLKNGMNCSFRQWFIYKNSCCANFGFLIEGIILTPVLCKGGMLAYNNFIKES